MSLSPLHRFLFLLTIGAVLALVGCGTVTIESTSSDSGTTASTTTGGSSTSTTTGTSSTSATATPTSMPTPTATTGSTPSLGQLTVYVGCGDGNFYGVNAANGSKRWSYTVGDAANKPSPINGIVYASTPGGQVFALNAGTLLWHTSPGGGFNGRPAVDPNANLVLVGADNNAIYALHMNDGSQAWSYATGGAITGSLFYDNGLVFAGSVDGKVYAVHENNGSLAWSASIAAVEYASPTGDNGGTLYIGADDGNVYALNESNGAILWKHATGGQILAKPSIVNGVVYIGSDDYNLYALHASNGSEIWHHGFPDNVGTPLVVNNEVLVGSSDGTVAALRTSDGSKIWSKTVGGLTRPWFSTTQGVLYVGSNDSNLYAFDAGSGAQDWKFSASSGCNSPTVGQ
jgi:outer membrane protein assembly factor BamB